MKQPSHSAYIHEFQTLFFMQLVSHVLNFDLSPTAFFCSANCLPGREH